MSVPKLTEVFRLDESVEIPLVIPKDKRDQFEDFSEWLGNFVNDAWKMIPSSLKRWDSQYDSEAKQYLRSTVRRVVEELRSDDPDAKLAQVTGQGNIKFCFLDPFELEQRGDFRYGSDELADVINSGKDLTPISAGSSDGGRTARVLDTRIRPRFCFSSNGSPRLRFSHYERDRFF